MIYLDNNSTTRVYPEVIETVRPFLAEEWGNPSSPYKFGAKLRSRLEEARDSVAALIGSRSHEIIFTSCATESNNAAVTAALRLQPNKQHIITTAVEHSSVLNHCRQLENEGVRVTYLGVSSDGLLDLGQLRDAITDDTAIVSVMWANNETGVIFPVVDIATICAEKGVLFHTDAAQAVAKVKLNVEGAGIAFLSITGHKLHAPKGVGALYVNRRVAFRSYLTGGHQENGRRGGTENVLGIIGLGKAAQLAARSPELYATRIRTLRDQFEAGVLSTIERTRRNGHKETRLPNTTNISFEGIESDALLMLLDQAGVCVSAGSACLADSEEPSHVLKAMGRTDQQARNMIRFSLSEETTASEIEAALKILLLAVENLRSVSIHRDPLTSFAKTV